MIDMRIPLPNGAAAQCQFIPADYGAQMVTFKLAFCAVLALALLVAWVRA